MTWPDWIEKHSVTFGMADEANLRMLAEWAGLFATYGYSPDEVADATGRIALLDAPPRFRQDQLPALVRLVRDARAGKFEPRRPDAPPASACKLCGGDGMLGVPDYRGMQRYEALWKRPAPFRTFTAHCRCPLGLWKSKQPKRSLQSLAEYEAEFPEADWRRDLEQHRLEEEAYRKAQSHAGELDRTLGKLMRKWKGV